MRPRRDDDFSTIENIVVPAADRALLRPESAEPDARELEALIRSRRLLEHKPAWLLAFRSR